MIAALVPPPRTASAPLLWRSGPKCTLAGGDVRLGTSSNGFGRFPTFVTVPGTAAGTCSIFHRLFEEKTLRQERLGHVIDILFGHAAGKEMVAPPPNDRYDVLDFLPRPFGGQPEPLALGKQVVDACRAA